MDRQGLRNVWLVFKREYIERVYSRSFVLTTLLMPAFLLATVLVPAALSGPMSAGAHTVVIVSPDRTLGALASHQLEAGTEGAFSARVVTNASPPERARLDRALREGHIDAYVWLGPDVLKTGDVLYFTHRPGDFVGRELVGNAVTFAIRRERLIKRGVAPSEAQAMLGSVRMKTVDVGARGAHRRSDPLSGMLAAFGLVFLLFITLLSYGVMVMRSIMEEKGSRVIEVLLCSLTARQLMAGKIAGTGTVGLTQAAVWGAIIILLAPWIATILHTGTTGHLAASWLIYFAVFYVLGFLLYAALFAAVGAAFDSMDDAQQWNFVVISPLIAASVLMGPVAGAPDSSFAAAVSMVPFCSPLLMYTRIVVGHPPLWQVCLSIALLLATTYLAFRLCARIYRVGILMYGKRARFGEVIRWMRYP